MRLGLLGLGFMGSTHLKALKNIPGVDVVLVCSDDPVKLTGDLSAVQGNIGGPGDKLDFSNVRKYADAFDAIRDREVDAFDICLPTHLHGPVALEAIRAGKHVLVEKPMGLNAAEVDAMLSEAGESGTILMTAQVLRFLPPYVALRQALQELGAVRSALFRRRCAAPFWSRWLNDPARSGGGVFDLLIHDVDMCLHLFGTPEAVSAWGHEDASRGIDWISAQFHYPEIASVMVTGGWHHPKSYPFSMQYTVVADEGTVEYDSAGTDPTLYRVSGESAKLDLPSADGFQAELEYFIDCVRNNRKPELCPPEQSATAVKLTRLMAEARTRKGERVPCNL